MNIIIYFIFGSVICLLICISLLLLLNCFLIIKRYLNKKGINMKKLYIKLLFIIWYLLNKITDLLLYIEKKISNYINKLYIKKGY